MTLRVADLFCGGGGISEGLRQAGLEIVYGVLRSPKKPVILFAVVQLIGALSLSGRKATKKKIEIKGH